ncbi:MAG: DUF4124 domain-containing protein [Halioglobus sp.]
MLKKLLVFTCLTLAISANAEIYRCEDPATGKLTFTDTVCKDKTKGAYIPIGLTDGTSTFASKKDIENGEKMRIADDNKAAIDRSRHNEIALQD